MEEDVEKDGSEDQPGLQEAVLNEVDLVGLLDGGVGHHGGVEVLGVDRHPRSVGPGFQYFFFHSPAAGIAREGGNILTGIFLTFTENRVQGTRVCHLNNKDGKIV